MWYGAGPVNPFFVAPKVRRRSQESSTRIRLARETRWVIRRRGDATLSLGMLPRRPHRVLCLAVRRVSGIDASAVGCRRRTTFSRRTRNLSGSQARRLQSIRAVAPSNLCAIRSSIPGGPPSAFGPILLKNSVQRTQPEIAGRLTHRDTLWQGDTKRSPRDDVELLINARPRVMFGL